MSKPREFWIDNPNEAPTLAYSHPDQVLQSRKATMVHVREVSPELDKAIEGLVIAIEKMLEMYPKEIFDGNSGDEGPQRIVDAYNALAAYHSAKESEKVSEFEKYTRDDVIVALMKSNTKEVFETILETPFMMFGNLTMDDFYKRLEKQGQEYSWNTIYGAFLRSGLIKSQAAKGDK